MDQVDAGPDSSGWAFNRNQVMQPVIQTEGLKKTYFLAEPVHALRGVNLNIEAGEFVAVMGASGSGKSTLMNIIGCLDRPTEGNYELDGIDVSGLSRNEQAEIRSALQSLQRKEMIYPRRRGTIAGFKEYAIKHTILREVTYETVLRRLRPVYHGLVAEWLIDNGADNSSEFTPVIADHLERAGQNERAGIYLRIAGEQSMKQYANDEAIAYLSRALELLPQ